MISPPPIRFYQKHYNARLGSLSIAPESACELTVNPAESSVGIKNARAGTCVATSGEFSSEPGADYLFQKNLILPRSLSARAYTGGGNNVHQHFSR
jgi:hypothetical protein